LTSKLNRKIRPEEKEQISFKPPKTMNVSLSNGLKIVFIEKKDLPIVQLSLILEAGSKFDLPGKRGLAYLHSLLIDEGAGKFKALELDDEFEKLGSVFSVSIDEDFLFISLLTLRENIKKSLELFSLIIKKPRLSREDFNREKIKQLTKILQSKDQPDYLANLAFEKEIFKNTPYAFPIMGIEADVSSLKLKDVKEFNGKFVNANNAHLIVVGNIEKRELIELTEEYFNDWKAGEKVNQKIKPIKNKGSRLIVIDKKGAQQSEIRVGHISSGRKARNYFEKEILNSVLGGQFSSRLNLNLREKKGFTYGIHSSFYYNKNFGQFNISTSVDTRYTQKALKEIYKEIKKIREEGILPEELNFTKSYLIKKFPSLFETYGQMVRNFATKILFGLPDSYFNSYISKLGKFELNDVNNVVKKVFRPDDLTCVVIGDGAEIKNQLKKDDEFGEIITKSIDDVVG